MGKKKKRPSEKEKKGEVGFFGRGKTLGALLEAPVLLWLGEKMRGAPALSASLLCVCLSFISAASEGEAREGYPSLARGWERKKRRL